MQSRTEGGKAAGAERPPRLRLASLRSQIAGPFDLELAAGGCVAVSGPSGSGKSLFLRMIADLDPNTGEVALDGVSRAAMSGPAWRRKAPYVAAESGWWLDTPARHFQPGDLPHARELAGKLGLEPEAMDREVRLLSTGERQRLAIIRALVLASPVLLLDEPTGPLDPDGARRVEALLAERLGTGLALVLVTHDPGQADRLGARRLHMRERRLEPV
jgi:ABC-type lipoprotein export system ATPase subunit